MHVQTSFTAQSDCRGWGRVNGLTRELALATETVKIGREYSAGMTMAAYLIFDVDIRDMARYQDFAVGVKPALEAAGARYLARGGALTVYEGDWQPRRIVMIEFPSAKAADVFYNSETYRSLKAIRDECSSARLVLVDGI